jgi:sugar transferase (PEP-CTERM/EpsH1 system associated)
MQELLFLAHRIPYPPDKGDKIRSWHFLTHLARRYRVHLGCFVDDPRDWQFRDVLRELCGECCFVRLDPRLATLRSTRGLLSGIPLTVPYYFDRRLDRWVRDILARPQVTHSFVYCSAMAQYVTRHNKPGKRRVADIVDLDSEKWADYARNAPRSRRWLYAREAASLRAVERSIASTFDATLLATEVEATLLQHDTPAASDRITCVGNGVDSDYFSPDRPYENPFEPGVTLVFSGAMDYLPNADAAVHFAEAILPAVRRRLPGARFVVVGSKPRPEVMALAAGEGITVTGRVPDVRPYLAHASAIVAPLRIARGVQNKVLEGMAMAKPVIASPAALGGIAASVGTELLRAETPDEFADAIAQAVTTGSGAEIGRNARRRVVARYSWSASWDRLDGLLEGEPAIGIANRGGGG